MTTYAYTTWFFPIFLVACISSVLFVSIRSVLKPLSQYESHITSEGHGNSDSKWKLAPRNRGYSNGIKNMSQIEHHDMHYSHRQNYDSRRFPWLYRNILQQEESAKFGIHSGDGYHHTSQLREHLQRLQVEKLKKKEELQRSDSDENSDLTVLTDVSFAQPQGLHVNLEIKVEISQFRDIEKEATCSCQNEKNVLLGKEGKFLEKKISSQKENENENDGKCLKTRNIAVVFFLPSGCYIDQQEIEARHSFPVDAEKILLHTYAASSNPELLAEEAEGEVVVVEFFDLLDNKNCQCNLVENKNDNKYKESDNKYKTGNENWNENVDNEGSKNRNEDRNKRNNNKNHNRDYDSNSEYEIEHENENENENDSQEEGESGKRKRESDVNYHSFNTTQHTVHGNHHKTVKRRNIRTIITDFNFQLPIHLRYHTPYDDFLPVKNTKSGEYPYHKKVIIPYPTVFIGMENCLQNSRKEAKNAKNVPRIKRIYDVSFLGQTGNVQSSMISENFYVKLNGFVDKKNHGDGDGGGEHGGGINGGQGYDEEEEEYEHEKRQGEGEGGGGEELNRRRKRQRVRERDKVDEEERKGGKKTEQGRDEEREGEEEVEDEQTIELKVPVGCYSNDFVLIVTIACYFFSSSAIVYSLVF